jgi:thiol-disulfide isomerase/thioredoxin
MHHSAAGIVVEGQAVRVVAWIGIMAFCLGLTGCTLFGKKGSGSANPAGLAANDRGVSLPADQPAVTPSAPSTPPVGLNGMLAGQVLDSYNHRPPVTYIQVTDLQAPQGGGAPIEVAADSQGYFTILGLQPGRHYQLTARARDGNRIMAGIVMAVPPNPKLVIKISEDFATSTTPPLPPTTTWPGPVAPPDPNPAAPKLNQARVEQQNPVGGNTPGNPTWGPGSSATPGVPRQPTELKTPQGGVSVPGTAGQPGATPSPSAGIAPERVTDQQDIAKRREKPILRSPPALTWTAPSTSPEPKRDPPLSWTAPSTSPEPKRDPPLSSTGPARVPSCQLTGQLLYNFALNDLTGQPWEYRLHHRGRLVLLDFWETTCVPCQHAITHLKIWQDRYGPYGLEIIGIAYEQGTPEERVQKVDRVRQRLQINYRLLMGSDPMQCPVRVQFGVQAYPTLVLLDDNGRIIWRSEGLGKDSIAELETIFKQRLGLR